MTDLAARYGTSVIENLMSNERARRRASKSIRMIKHLRRTIVFISKADVSRERQIAQIRKTPVLEFVSQQERHATRASPLPNGQTKGYCNDLFLFLFFSSYPVKRVADLIAHANACALSRESPRRAEPGRAEPGRAELCRDSDFKERVTHMRVIYCRIKVARGTP